MFQDWEILMCLSGGVLGVPLHPLGSEGDRWEVCKQLPSAASRGVLLLLLLLPWGPGGAGIAGSFVSSITLGYFYQ